jgi:Tfp pilus assembly protein PilX
MKSVTRRAQGYVLLMVLVVLLVLTLLVAGLYSASEDGRFTAQTMMAQRVAAARADQAAQLALASIRAGLVTGTGFTYCSGPPDGKLRTGNCAAGNYQSSGAVNGVTVTATNSNQYENGGGAQYQWWVYRALNADGTEPAQAATVYNVYAEGYFGADSTQKNFNIAAVSAEITIPGATTGPPNFDGDYGVIH